MSRLIPVLLAVLLAACSSDPDGDATDPRLPGSGPTGPCVGSHCDHDASPSGEQPEGCTDTSECTREGTVCDPDRGFCVPGCSSDDQCSPVAQCDSDRGFCVPRPSCRAGEECPAGLACDSCLGACMTDPGGTRCQTDANCGFEEYCDPCLSICLERLALCAPCQEDIQCGELQDQCLTFRDGGRHCGSACGSCPVGYDCDSARGQCVPLSGRCDQVRQCEVDADCPGAQICSLTSLCTGGCTDNSACQGDDVCSAGRCGPPCGGDGDCPAGQECREDQRCWVPGGCLTSEDCTEPETYCDRAEGLCVPGCQIDVDCMDATQECSAGSCIRRACRGNYSCAFQEVCNFETGTCEPDPRPHCSPCDAGDVDSCGAENICVELQDDEGNAMSESCFLQCGDDPLNDCPQGYRCTEVEVDGSPRRVCFIPRCDDPV